MLPVGVINEVMQEDEGAEGIIVNDINEVAHSAGHGCFAQSDHAHFADLDQCHRDKWRCICR